jgi:hypothetical protein
MFRLKAVIFALAGLLNVAADRISLADFGILDRTGHADASAALAKAIRAANRFTSKGEPACVYVPPGTYRIVSAPPAFIRAGCIRGDGTTQSIFDIDPAFTGDLFAWSEAWSPTTPGPTITGLKIRGSAGAIRAQNAMVFYDRNDQVFIDNVEVDQLHGRALYSGVKQHSSQAYMRESHMRSLRFFLDGAPGVPVVEFSSEGAGKTDATNEIAISQLDIYGPAGPGFVIRNNGTGGVRDFMIEALRIEGWEAGTGQGDLMTIGDTHMRGNVNNIRLTDVELIDPQASFAALRLTAAPGASAPYQITVDGFIGGGNPRGEGLRIDAGRASVFRLSGIHTLGTNVAIGRGINGIVIDGGGQEAVWTYAVDAMSSPQVLAPNLKPILAPRGGPQKPALKP